LIWEARAVWDRKSHNREKQPADTASGLKDVEDEFEDEDD
jgi:hypothetical protein